MGGAEKTREVGYNNLQGLGKSSPVVRRNEKS